MAYTSATLPNLSQGPSTSYSEGVFTPTQDVQGNSYYIVDNGSSTTQISVGDAVTFYLQGGVGQPATYLGFFNTGGTLDPFVRLSDGSYSLLGAASVTSSFVITQAAYTQQGQGSVCFHSGTLIRTARGNVVVEHLAVGEMVVTSSGEHRPIRWLGQRTIEPRRYPEPLHAQPLRVQAHAFAPGRPARDLRVSPGHALCLDVTGEVLIPAMALINGSTVVQEEVDSVTYWHVELDSHDILLAENMPAESYLDMGNRAFFAGEAVVDLAAGPDAAPRSHADFCRPFHADGDVVAIARSRLRQRLPALGWQLVEPEPWGDVVLLVDGRPLRPKTRGLTACFELPAGVCDGARDLWLTCGTGVPGEVSDSADERELGLCLAAITLDDGLGEPRAVALDDALLGEGFHQHQGDHRWTAGRARLPAELLAGLDGTAFLRLALHTPPLPRWTAPALDEAGSRAA